MQIPSPQTIKGLFPKCANPDGLSKALATVSLNYQINTPYRLASFIAQTGHESAGFSTFSENLMYRAETLLKVFPKYFTSDSQARAYEKRPEAIANRVYGGRMGNGPETSGEGFKYRGRGCIQLTGKDNYRAAGLALKVDLLTNPDLACEMPYALETAAWFWNSRGLNALADAQDQVGICKRVNGGVIGLEERKTLYQKVLAVVS